MEKSNDRYVMVDGELVRRVIGGNDEGGGDAGAAGSGEGSGADAGAGEGAGSEAGATGAEGKGTGAAGAAGAGEKGEGGAAKSDSPAQAAADPLDAVPENGEYTFAKIKNEKGEEADIVADIATPVAKFAKEAGLTQRQAQALAEREVQLQAEAQKTYDEQGQRMQAEWKEQARKDEVLNANGKYDENIAIARKALDQFFPELAAEADKHVFLDHPTVLRGLLKVGQAISEDTGTPAGGQKSGNTQDDLLRKMYPSMAK